MDTEHGLTLGGSTRCTLPFPPPLGNKNTRLINVSEESGRPPLSVLRQDFGTSQLGIPVNAYINCFVLRINSDFMIYSPISLTEEAQRLFDQVLLDGVDKKVKHIVCPSLSPEHWTAAEQAHERWPDATLWICPGALDGWDKGSFVGSLFDGPSMWKRLKDKGAVIKVIEDGAVPQEMGGEVEFALFKGPGGFTEASCLLKAYQSLVLCDLAFSRSEPEELRASEGFNPLKDLIDMSMGPSGIKERLGAPIGVLTMSAAREEGRRWREKVLGWKDWDDLYCLHLSPVVTNGREELRRAFEFLD